MEINPMEYKTSILSPEEELELIKSYILEANNLPKNLNTLRLMGIGEPDIKEILCGNFVLVFEGIINPIIGNKIFAGPARVEINSNGDECCAQVFINHRPAEEFFAEPIPEPEKPKDIESLKDENEELRTKMIDFQKRYDDIWEYCKDLERKYKELEQKSRN